MICIICILSFHFEIFNFCRFMSVLICLIFSVLSTIEEYTRVADDHLYWMVGYIVTSGANIYQHNAGVSSCGFLWC